MYYIINMSTVKTTGNGNTVTDECVTFDGVIFYH